jgi:ubiquinol-cytochrome c reductase cytochrome c1 subunit
MNTYKVMRRFALLTILAAFGTGYTTASLAAGGGACGAVTCLDPHVDLDDRPALQRGAKLFVNYCLSCHSATFMRYNRMAKDLGISEEQLQKNLMFATKKSGNPMNAAMTAEDGKKWFGKAPPDLSVIARARGESWLYTYLMTFYRDDAKATGANNLVFKDVGMPHVMADMQGIQVLREHPAEAGEKAHHGPRNVNEMLMLASPGSSDPSTFRRAARDLTGFLVYMGEPAKLVRYKIGIWVLVFLSVLYLLSRSLYKEYWKDIH